MIIKSAVFIKSACKPSHYPPEDIPEIAFSGRSNVGKSSLINTLVNIKRLAKTSSTPGRTQMLNFFMINNQFMFVDLPGYGYAKVPVHIKSTWEKMVMDYLIKRQQLCGVVVIIDIRRTPDQDEKNLIDWLRINHIPEICVLTKADKLSYSKQVSQRQLCAKTLDIAKEEFILFSSTTRMGKEALWEVIQKRINTINPSVSGYEHHD
ncbi:MAG: YihA family ribosome biogenesis GTP-binding protein [Desulfobacterales bacterium]|nr:YihA family ribosome biogenesis GTP-binding protein [Desulfobacterales bacterium]